MAQAESQAVDRAAVARSPVRELGEAAERRRSTRGSRFPFPAVPVYCLPFTVYSLLLTVYRLLLPAPVRLPKSKDGALQHRRTPPPEGARTLRRSRPIRLSMAESPSGDKRLPGRVDGQEVQRYWPAGTRLRV